MNYLEEYFKVLNEELKGKFGHINDEEKEIIEHNIDRLLRKRGISVPSEVDDWR